MATRKRQLISRAHSEAMQRMESEAIAADEAAPATVGAAPNTGPYMSQSQFGGNSAAGRERANRPSEAELAKRVKK